MSLTIGALSRRSGCHIETIRYYERVGVLPSPARSPGGHRLYEPAHVERLRFVRRSRELGFSLQEIRELLALVDSETVTCGHVQAVTLEHAQSIREKIADLRRMERTLRAIAARCDGTDSPDCPIIESLFAPGR